MTEAMPFLQKTILLSYDPRPLFRGGLFVLPPPRFGFVPPPRRWEQGRTTRPEGACPVGRLPPLPLALPFAPIPQPPSPPGKGETKVISCKGLRPLHPRG